MFSLHLCRAYRSLWQPPGQLSVVVIILGRCSSGELSTCRCFGCSEGGSAVAQTVRLPRPVPPPLAGCTPAQRGSPSAAWHGLWGPECKAFVQIWEFRGPTRMSVLTSAATRQLELWRRQDWGAELTHGTSGLSALLHALGESRWLYFCKTRAVELSIPLKALWSVHGVGCKTAETNHGDNHTSSDLPFNVSGIARMGKQVFCWLE